jgi:hypothetical protein
LTLIKSIVACLVLANVGYFLWARGIAESPQSEMPVPVPPGAGASLKLASESPGRRPAAAEAGVGVAIDGGGSGISGGGAGGSGASANAGGASANAGGASANAGSGSGIGSGGGGNASSGSAVPPREQPAANLLTNVKRCISVGPFREVSEAAHAAATLRAAHYDPRQRAAEGEVWAGVWVYLPTPAGRGAADQVLAKLKAGGIDDALEMPGPNDGSVISLGLFSEPKRAQARVAQAQAMGLNPGIADRKRTGNVFWIDIDLKPTDTLLNPADLQGEAGRIVRLEVKGCPASAAGGAS